MNLTTVERDAILAAIDAKSCHLTGQAWEGGNGKELAWPDADAVHGIP